MTSTKTLSIAIDPTGAQTGGRVVARTMEEVSAAAAKAERSVEGFSSKSTKAIRDVGEATQQSGRQVKDFSMTTEQALAAATRQMSLATSQSRLLTFQLNDVFQSFALGMPVTQILLQQGPQIAQIYGAGEGGIGRAFKETAVMATNLVARLWPVAAAAAGVYGAYKLIQSYSFAARTDVDALTRSMAEQAMSAGSLKGAISDFASMRESLVDATGISGALGNLISLQGNYSGAISNTGTVQAQVSSTVVDNLRREFNAKRAVLEVEAQLQQAKIATMRADIALKAQQFESEIGKTVFTNGNLEAQGFYDPRIGRFTSLPDDVSGLAKTQEAIDRLNKNPEFLAFKKLKADLSAAEVAADQLNSTLKTSFEEVALGKGMNNLSKLSSTAFAPAVQGATSLSTAVGGISTAAATASTGVVNVTQTLATARMQTLSAMQQTSTQVSTMKKDLADIQATLAAASKTPAAEIFGNKFTGQAAADAIANASNSIQKVMVALRDGGTTAAMAHESIELVRQSLIAMGADSKAVDQFVNGMVAGYVETVRLKGAIDQLSSSIMGIPNRVISIGIQQYTVPSSGGGTKGVNVYGGQADFSYQEYTVGGKKIGVSGGNGAVLPPRGLVSQSDVDNMLSLQGYRAAGGPVSAGGTYMVGENGPELLTMSGPGQVTNANSTASILSGGRDTLSLIEDHLYDVVQELRIHTNYFESFESDYSEMIACLKAIKSVGSSSSYSGGGSSYSSGSSYSGSSSSDSGNNVRDPMSPYYFNAARNNAGRGGGRYDPVADALINGNTEALRNLSGGPTAAISRALAGHNMPSLLDRLKKQAGFATGGQIMPGEDQKVEFFKRNKERVIIVDDNRVSDQRGGQQQAKSDRPVNVTINQYGVDQRDPRSRQAQADEIRRVVQQAVRS